MRVVSLPNPSSVARSQTAGTFAVVLRVAALLLFPLLTACVDRTMSPSGSVASVEAPAFAIAGPRAPALLVTSLVLSEDSVADERPFRFDGASGAFLGQLQQATTPTSHREMAFGPDGHLYVVDGLGNSVVRYDGTTGASLGAFVPAGRGLGNPSGLAFGPEGDLYVANGSDNRVRQYNGTTGLAVRTYSGLSDAQSVTFRGDGTMFVASRGYSDVRRFDRGLNRFVVFVTAGNGGLSQPTSLRFGPDGHLYVASHGTGSIIRYDGMTGRLIGTFASGSGLVAPGGIAFGPDGELYVSDFASGSVLRFDGGTGAFLDTFIPAGTAGLSSPRYLVFSSPPVNRPPAVVAGGPYRGLEGSPIAFDASGTMDPDGDALRFDWDFGNGATGTGARVTHVYDDDGQYTAVLTVTDERGATSAMPAEVTVENVAPSANFAAPSSVTEGSTFELSVSGATDPSPGDTEAGFTYAFDCGDGTAYSAMGAATSIVCATTDDGSRSVGVRVADRDGGESEYRATVEVTNALPELTTLTAPATSLRVGDVASLRVGISDAGSADTHSASIDWGDGTTTDGLTSAGVASGSHAYAAAGTYTIAVRVTDDDGGSSVLAFSGIQVSAPTGGLDDDSNPPASTRGSIVGGGRLESPAGAHVGQPAHRGWASFAVVARFNGNDRAPEGSFLFDLDGTNFKVKSTSFTSLVVVGSDARLVGRATVNGRAGYAFRLTVRDAGSARLTGQGDAVRVRVWEVSTGRVVYDNELQSAADAPASVPMAAGSVRVHSPGGPAGSTNRDNDRDDDNDDDDDRKAGKDNRGNSGNSGNAPGKNKRD